MSVSDFQNRSEHVSDDSNSIGVMPTKFCSGNVSCHNHRNENKSQSPECKEFVIIGRWSKSRLSHIKQIVYNCRQWSQWYRALLHVVRTLAILHWSVSGWVPTRQADGGASLVSGGARSTILVRGLNNFHKQFLNSCFKYTLLKDPPPSWYICQCLHKSQWNVGWIIHRSLG